MLDKLIDELKKIRGLPKNLSHKDLDQIIYIIQEAKKIDKIFNAFNLQKV